MKRYEALAEAARSVPDGVRVERNLGPLREQSDTAAAEYDSLADRLSLATCQVTLIQRGAANAPTEPIEPYFYATATLSHLVDARSNSADGLLGAGVSVRLLKYLVFELDVYRRVNALAAPAGLDGLLLTVGADGYSDRFGSGERRFFNPRLGLRVGVSALSGRVDLAIGGAVGLEVYKTHSWNIGVQLTALVLVGNHDGPHAGIQSELYAGFGF